LGVLVAFKLKTDPVRNNDGLDIWAHREGSIEGADRRLGLLIRKREVTHILNRGKALYSLRVKPGGRNGKGGARYESGVSN